MANDISIERKIYLEKLVPEFISEIDKFKAIYDNENITLDKLYANIEKIKDDVFITSASNEAIERIESFINIKGQGTLEQRKNYLKSLIQKGNKLNESSIKDIVKTITGSDCIITFFAANETDGKGEGNSLLRVEVLSPDNEKDYRYDDIARTLTPLVPCHIRLSVIKFFASWDDVKINHADWNSLLSLGSWKAVNQCIPPR